MLKTNNGLSNHVFSSFSVSLQRRLCTSVKQLELPAGKTLFSSQEALSYLYFPINCVIHMIYEVDDGDEVQIACLGRHDICGDAMFTGHKKSPVRAQVLLSGEALVLPAKEALYWFNNEREFREPILKACARINHQMMQKVACYRFHTIHQQLCCWLLEVVEQVDAPILDVTHEEIAHLLGVRREGISAAAHKLQLEGIIDYKRGHIKILNRKRLEQLTCECYNDLKQLKNL
ncbi:Crp/Fnr family transcriptional regulator [Kangiella sp. M94]